MNRNDNARASRLLQLVQRFQIEERSLPGLASVRHEVALVAQFIDSLRRIEFAHHIRDARHDLARADPESDIFDPLRAAVLRNRQGAHDEAWWLVFLGTHFGKHMVDGWRLTRDVYGKLGQGGQWSWPAISRDPSAFRTWLGANEATLRGADGVSRRFSNHRKYESLRITSNSGTASILTSYVAWVAPPRTHDDLVHDIHRKVGQDPHAVFSELYKSMDAVRRFGRLGKFDFLAMLGKLGIAPIEPGSTFLNGATGPLAGARLLFGGTRGANLQVHDLETMLASFGQMTGLGAQVLEDAICNWQKSPETHVRFRG